MIDLKALATSRRWRTALDESAQVPGQSAEDRAWLVIVPCKYGEIGIHSRTELSATSARRRIARSLCQLRGIRVHQRGDQEATIVFGPEHLDCVAKLLQPRQRRVLSEEQRRRLVEMGSAHWFEARGTERDNAPDFVPGEPG
jgi:hypothetical protein